MPVTQRFWAGPLAAALLAGALAGPGRGRADTPSAARLPDAEAEVATFAVAPEDSVLAVVTHKGGAAARLAHDHLVLAADAPTELEFSPRNPGGARFAAEIRVEGLQVDDPASQERWYPRLAELRILAEPFKRPSESDRAKIRRAMLSEEQLDLASHPTLEVRLVAVREEPATVGDVAFTHAVDVAWTIRGVEVQRPAAARWEEKEGVVMIEAVGALRFTDFVIQPYSAVLGAVRNQDEFHVYLRLVGRAG